MATRAYVENLLLRTTDDVDTMEIYANIHFFDSTTPRDDRIGVAVRVAWTTLPAAMKNALSAQIISDGAGYGYTISANAQIVYPDLSRG